MKKLLPCLLALVVLTISKSTLADENETRVGPELDTYQKTVARGIAFLKNKGQADDGTFTRRAGPGVTFLAVTAMLRHGVSVEDPAVAGTLKYLECLKKPDGGIHVKQSLYKNYETCLAVMCFKEANQDGRYDELLKNAEKFLKRLQWDDEEGHEEDSPFHGGGGYGKHNRPDLSNTSFLIEALRNCGTDENDSAIRKALIFVSRCQNLESVHNTTPFSAKVNDGGFYYTGAAGGSGETTSNGGLRSYGSMTYAGLKSLIFAGLKRDDPRVKAAIGWIQKNYGLTSNPGLGDSGLYYYYHTFAKTLHLLGDDHVVDVTGTPRDWRRDLAEELFRRQNADGSWVNDNARWLESDPNLVTAYALLTLNYCRPKITFDSEVSGE